MKAYITLLSTDSYYDGVVALSRSLQMVSSRYPLYVAISRDVSDTVCDKLISQDVNIIKLGNSVNIPEGSAQTIMPHWSYTFDKLQIWGLTQFEKLVFLDSDMMVVRNIDHLFDREPFSAVAADCSYPGNEGWAGGLNSGLMVIVPNKDIENSLVQMAESVIKDFQMNGKSVGDQDVIKAYCKKWATSHNLHLDEGYNVFADHITYYVRNLGYSLSSKGNKPIYVVHFIGKFKPWMRFGIKDIVRFIVNIIKNPYYLLIFNKYKTLL